MQYGEPTGYTAMAKTVGYPAAIATKMVLDGEIQKVVWKCTPHNIINIIIYQAGMVLPFSQDIYKPILTRLKAEGISAIEKSTFLSETEYIKMK